MSLRIPKSASAAAALLSPPLGCERGGGGELTVSSPTFPPAVHHQLHELVGRFDGDVFPLLIVLSDRAGGYAIYRWPRFDMKLEELVQTPLAWPAVILTLVAADGGSASSPIERPMLQ